MQHTLSKNPEIKLVGISVRTSYNQEADKMKGNIFPCVQSYFHGALFEIYPNVKNREQPFVPILIMKATTRGPIPIS